MPVNVIFSNKSSPLNKKLIKFFQINLLSLNKASIVFEFEIATPKDMKLYVERGIKNYPVLIDKLTKVTGVEKIIEYLQMQVKQYNTKILSKTDNDRVDEFWKQTMGNVRLDESGKLKPDDDDDNENSSIGENLQHKIQEIFELRNTVEKPGSAYKPTASSTKNTSNTKNTKNTNKINNTNNAKSASKKPRTNNLECDSPFKTLNAMKKNGCNADDDLMTKFFENMEEST
jgi:hypothetical protein